MRALASLSLGTLLVLLPAIAKATTFSDDFSSTTPALSLTSVGNFTAINGTNVDLLGPDGLNVFCSGAAYCVDLGGTGGDPYGDLRSNVLFGPGTYNLSFNLTGSMRGSNTVTEVTFGDYDVIFSLNASDSTSGMISNQFVTITTPGYLTVALLSADDPLSGSLLKSVSVESLEPVPEPSSLVLLGSGALSTLGMALRRRKV